MAAMDKMTTAVQGTGLARCPTCGTTGVPSKELFMASMLGSELPLDFEVYHCSRKHYWRIWDDGTTEPIIPGLQV